MKIGILGGSFNPIHFGHLILAENVGKEAGLDKVILMPANTSPFKVGTKSASNEDRFNMVKLAVSGNEYLEASDFESASERISYTIDTMKMLREIYPSDELYFILGADSALTLEKWKGAEELITQFPIRIGGRPGYDDEKLEQYVEGLRDKYDADICVVEIPKADVSSTEIRKRSREGRSIKYLTPDAVAEYIVSGKIY